ncbi:hypothetical protein LCGC14_2490500 [marine sediment metagenome]|uniref:Lipoprotein n=1 Tax=marine sediment metagenome TaxID=412755 RepID=A0A0F9B5J5_9ZZZZ
MKKIILVLGLIVLSLVLVGCKEELPSELQEHEDY